eukprot:6860957-Prymnesium_polylepis.1
MAQSEHGYVTSPTGQHGARPGRQSRTCGTPVARSATKERTTPPTSAELTRSTAGCDAAKRKPPTSAANVGAASAVGGASIGASSKRRVPPCSMYATSSA